jgi:hypothetical protein
VPTWITGVKSAAWPDATQGPVELTRDGAFLCELLIFSCCQRLGMFPLCSHGRGNPWRRILRWLAPHCAVRLGQARGHEIPSRANYTRELDLDTLVWTRGPSFPLSSLDGRLMCPRCKSRRVAVMFQPPTTAKAARV